MARMPLRVFLRICWMQFACAACFGLCVGLLIGCLLDGQFRAAVPFLLFSGLHGWLCISLGQIADDDIRDWLGQLKQPSTPGA